VLKIRHYAKLQTVGRNHWATLFRRQVSTLTNKKYSRQSRLAILHKSKREATPRAGQTHSCFTFAFAQRTNSRSLIIWLKTQ